MRTARADDDLFDARFGVAQLGFAMRLQRRAALVDRDRILKIDLALFEPLDDVFQLLQRLFERKRGDVGVVLFVFR